MPGSAAERLARLADGYLVTQLLHVAIALGVPEALAGGPRSADDLAAELGAVPGPLRRVLRGLAAEEVLEEGDDGRFSLSGPGWLLLPGVPSSLRGAVTARADLYYRAAVGLLDAVRTGGTPFELVHGQAFFPILSAAPERLAAFRASMADRSAREAGAVVDVDVSRDDAPLLHVDPLALHLQGAASGQHDVDLVGGVRVLRVLSADREVVDAHRDPGPAQELRVGP